MGCAIFQFFNVSLFWEGASFAGSVGRVLQIFFLVCAIMCVFAVTEPLPVRHCSSLHPLHSFRALVCTEAPSFIHHHIHSLDCLKLPQFPGRCCRNLSSRTPKFTERRRIIVDTRRGVRDARRCRRCLRDQRRRACACRRRPRRRVPHGVIAQCCHLESGGGVAVPRRPRDDGDDQPRRGTARPLQRPGARAAAPDGVRVDPHRALRLGEAAVRPRARL